MIRISSCFLILIVAAGAPWLFGGVSPWCDALAPSITLLAALLWIWTKPDSGMSRWTWGAIAIAGLLLGFVWLQAAPLPEGVFRSLTAKQRIDRIDQLRVTNAHCNGVTTLGTRSDPLAPWTRISSDPTETQRRWASLATLLAVGLISTSLAGDGRCRLAMIFWLAINGAVFGVLAIFMRASSPGLIYWTVKPQSQPFPFGAFVNRNHAGLFLSLSGLLALFGIVFLLSQRIAPFYRKLNEDSTGAARGRGSVSVTELRIILLSQKDTVLYFLAICALICGVCSISAASRSGILAFGSVTLIAALMFFLINVDRRLICAILFLGVLAAILSATKLEFLINRFEADAIQKGWFGRSAHWGDILEQTSEFAISGTGYGTYAYATLPYISNANSVWFKNADNQFVESFVELGAIGSVLIFAFVVSLGIRCIALLRTRELQSVIVGLLGCGLLAICFINAMADFALIMPGVALPMAVVMGLVLGFRTQESQNEPMKVGALGLKYGLRGAVVLILAAAATIGVSQLSLNQAVTAPDANPVRWAAGLVAKSMGIFNPKTASHDAEQSIASFIANARSEIQSFASNQFEEEFSSLENLAVLKRAISNEELDVDFDGLRNALDRVEPLKAAQANYLAIVEVAPMRFENHLALAKINLLLCPGRAVSEEISKVRQINPLSGPDSARAGIISIINGDLEIGGELLGQALRQEANLEKDIFKVLKSELTVKQVAINVLKQDPVLLIRAADRYYNGSDEWVARNFLYAQLRSALEAGHLDGLSDSEAKYYLAKTQRVAGDHEIAFQTYAEACEYWDAPIEWHDELARYFQEQGRFRDAKKVLMKMQNTFGYDNNRDKQIKSMEKRIRATSTLPSESHVSPSAHPK